MSWSVTVTPRVRTLSIRRFSQDRLHDLLRDRRGGLAAEPALVLERDSNCDLQMVGRGEGDEPGRVAAGNAGLGRTRLAGDGDAPDLRLRPGTARHGRLHHLVDLARDLRRDDATLAMRLRPRHELPVAGPYLLHEVGAHPDAVIRDRRRDRRHLERRHEQPLLAEREPAGVDLRRRVLRVEELVPPVEAARTLRVERQVDSRLVVEAELLRVVEDRAGADLLADVAEHRVDGVLQRREERERAEDLRADLRVARVRDALAVLDAVAGIDELGV